MNRSPHAERPRLPGTDGIADRVCMSFSCPHFDYDGEACMRLKKPCVPGRPGCVLRKNSEFAVPAEERIRRREAESGGDRRER